MLTDDDATMHLNVYGDQRNVIRTLVFRVPRNREQSR